MNVEFFREQLLDWYRKVRRDLPWRRTSDPYRIWISEIMLQQTRVAAVIPYYERFLARFPDPTTLAAAPEEDVLTHWAGLGYYSRARNLQKAAREMTGGAFPTAYEAIRELAGIGDYTASAVSSIAFGLPHAVVDGNVLRVLARVHNDSSDIASPKTKARFAAFAHALLDPTNPGDYNQAIMELGATVCTPKSPTCLLCPVREHCAGFAAGVQNQLPVKIRDGRKEDLTIVLLVIEKDGALLMRQSSRVAGFWDLPQADGVPLAAISAPIGSFTHQITFRRYTFEVVRAEVVLNPRGTEWIAWERLPEIPVSTVAKKALALIDR